MAKLVTTAYLNSDISGFQQGMKKATNLAKRELKGIQDTAKQFGDLFGGLTPQFGALTGNIGSVVSSLGALANPLTATIAAATAAGAAFFNYNKTLQETVRQTKQFLGLEGTELVQVRNKVQAIADTFGKDYGQALGMVDTLMNQFGINAESACQVLQDGFVAGADEAGNLESMLSNFGPALSDIGLSADEAMAVISQTRSGIFNEKGLDLLKEAGKQFGVLSTEGKTALSNIGVDYDKMMSQVSAGSMTTFEAIQQIVGKISELNPESRAAADAMKAMFGEKFVDGGKQLVMSLATMTTKMSDVKKQTGELGEAQEALVNATYEFENALASMFGISEGGWDMIITKLKTGVLTGLTSAITKLIEFWNSTIGIRVALTSVVNVLQMVLTIIVKLNQMMSATMNGLVDAVAAILSGKGWDGASKELKESLGQVKKLYNEAVTSIKEDLEDIGNAEVNTRINLIPNEIESSEGKGKLGGTKVIDPSTNKTGGTKTGGKDKKEIQAMKDSLAAYRQELSKVQELVEKGHLTPEDGKQKIDDLKKKIAEKEVELGLSVKVEDNSLADLQNKLSKINEQLQNGQYSESNIKYTVNKEDLIKQRKDIEKQIKDKEIELQVKVNDFKDELAKLELESKKLLIDVQVKETGPSLSSFEQAVQSVSTEPITYEIQLNGLKEAMDANDKLIESLQKQIEKYTELGTVGGENYQKLIDKIKELKEENKKLTEETKDVKTQSDSAKKMSENYGSATDAVGNLGSAFSSLGSSFENEGLNIAGIIAQAIAQVMLGLGEVIAQSASLTPFGWIAFSTMALAQAAAVVAQIHQLSGYAQGGIVHSGKSIGDLNTVRVNGGEMILNDT